MLHFCESIIAYFVDADAEKDTDKVLPRTWGGEARGAGRMGEK